jgi:hypothetical protein
VYFGTGCIVRRIFNLAMDKLTGEQGKLFSMELQDL